MQFGKYSNNYVYIKQNLNHIVCFHFFSFKIFQVKYLRQKYGTKKINMGFFLALKFTNIK